MAPRSDSGRLVIEIDPEIKKELYVALAKKQLTLREWFLNRVQEFLSDSAQREINFGANDKP